MHLGAAFLSQVIVSPHGLIVCILKNLFIPVANSPVETTPYVMDAAEGMSMPRDMGMVGRHTHKHNDVITHLQMHPAKAKANATPAQSQLWQIQ
jgi:hypothetical protein